MPAAQADNSYGGAAADKLGGLYCAEERAAAAMGAEQFAMMVEMTRKFTDSFEKEIRNGAE